MTQLVRWISRGLASLTAPREEALPEDVRVSIGEATRISQALVPSVAQLLSARGYDGGMVGSGYRDGKLCVIVTLSRPPEEAEVIHLAQLTDPYPLVIQVAPELRQTCDELIRAALVLGLPVEVLEIPPKETRQSERGEDGPHLLPPPGPALPLDFRSGYGVRADNPLLNDLPVTPPKLSRTGKSWVTVNRFGFDTASFDGSWVVDAFNSSLNSDSLVLDLGTGYGALTRKAIEAGATVISNDLALEHLLWARSQLPPESHRRLYLNTTPFPDLSIAPGSLTHVVAHRSLHFLAGEEIDRCLENCFRSLRTGGQLAIVIMSATHPRYREKFYDGYEARRLAGARWPGEWLDVEQHLPEQAYALPPILHVFTSQTLQEAVERHGFRVTRAGFVSLQKFGRAEDKRDGSESVGILAVKP